LLRANTCGMRCLRKRLDAGSKGQNGKETHTRISHLQRFPVHLPELGAMKSWPCADTAVRMQEAQRSSRDRKPATWTLYLSPEYLLAYSVRVGNEEWNYPMRLHHNPVRGDAGPHHNLSGRCTRTSHRASTCDLPLFPSIQSQ
jgi:hypothetical protein